MKQMITIEQLNELSDEQKDRLMEWWKPKAVIGDTYAEPVNFDAIPLVYEVYWKTPYHKEGDMISTKAIPLLSIGQMIDIINGFENFDSVKLLTMDKDELCDALWKAVKAVV